MAKSKSKLVDVTPTFTLKDIGSKIIDQLSTDVYTGAGSILRELVKNAYDGYLALDKEDPDSEDTTREIVISREREPGGTGRLFIADQAIGQSIDDLKANVQISISRKPDELENATGFRGLGSWASLGAGSQIIFLSSKKGDPFENRLTIDVRKVYSSLGPKTTLDDILNNKACIRMAQGPAEADDHYTTIEIVCDGPVESINGHELNRLYAFTDPAETELRKLLVQHCALPYVQDGDVHPKIHAIYTKTGYIPTAVVLDGTSLERKLPDKLTAFETTELKIGDQVAAIAWTVHDPETTGEVSGQIDEDDHNLAGPAIQITKLNVPIGGKRLYNEQHVREGLLDWYVGEVHILAPDILPNASGDGLRSGTARDAFIAVIKSFYGLLEEGAEKKSQRISLARNLRNAKQAATKLARGGLTPIQESQEKAKVGKGVELLQLMAKRGQLNQREKQIKEAAKDPTVIEIQKEAKKVLKDTGLLDEFTVPPSAKDAQPKKPAAQPKAAPKPAKPGVDTFQARVGQKLPKLQSLGLTAEQLDGVLAIIQELFEGT